MGFWRVIGQESEAHALDRDQEELFFSCSPKLLQLGSLSRQQLEQ